MLASTLTVQRLIMAFFCAPGKTTWPATIIRKKKQQEAELISHFLLGSGQLATGRCTETTGMPPPPRRRYIVTLPLPHLMSQSPGNKAAAAKMKRFSLLGFCPLNLPLFCPRAHFTSFTGGQTATWIQLCNVDCGVVRPASGADEWGIDKIDCAWQQEQEQVAAQCCYVSTYVIIQRRMSVIFYVFKGPPRRSPRKTGSKDRWSILSLYWLVCLYVCVFCICMPAGD